MKSDTPIDYAVFQLSPKRSRCELFVSRDGNIEKLASGLLKPFVSQLKIAEEQVALAAKSIKLETEKYRDGERWFTKGTLERFVRFVSTPEVLEMVNTFDAEMSQLEAARVIYSQGVEDHTSSTSGDGSGATTAADATKKELLRAIDVRLAAVKQDIATACARAAAAGFNHDSVSELRIFSDHFGAYRLNDACNKFLSLCERRPDLMNSWNSGVDDRTVRSSYGSDMSIDYEATKEQLQEEHEPTFQQSCEQSKLSSWQQLNCSSPTAPLRRSRECSTERDDTSSALEKKEESGGSEVEPLRNQPGPPARRLSVQDRISLFENKQKETSSGSGGKPVVAKSAELRRLSSDISSGSAAAEKAVLRRWSGVSDMSISVDLTDEKKEVDNTSSIATTTQPKPDDRKNLNSSAILEKPEFRSIPGIVCEARSEDQTVVSVKEEGKSRKAFVNPIIPVAASSGRAGDSCKSESSDLILGTVKIQENNLSSSSSSQAGVKDRPTSESQSRSFSFDKPDRFGFKNHGRSRSSIEQGGAVDQATSEMQIANLKEGGTPLMKPVTFASKSGITSSAKESYQPSGDHNLDGEEDLGSVEQSAPRSRLRAPMKTAMDFRQSDGGSKIRDAFSAQYRGSLGAPLGSQVSMKSIKETGEMKKQALASSEKHYASPILNIEDSGISKNMNQKQDPAREHTRKSQKSTSSSIYGNNNTLFSGMMVSKDQDDIFSTPETPAEQLQRIRQTKGNQELNDELKIKANELEKLFAEHKLRAPGDQSNSTRRSKHNDIQIEQASSNLPDRKQVADTTPQILDNNMTISSGSLSNVVNLDDGLQVDTADNKDYMDNVKYNVSDFGLMDESRGKCYDTYMQKRDTKLREEWGSRRTEKEAKLKEMQDIFECSRREMRDKLSGPTDRNDSAYSARRRAERLRSFKNQSSLKIEQPDFLQSEDEDPIELAEHKSFGQDSSINDASVGNGASRSTQNKRLLPNRNFSSSTPRNLAVAASRSASKASNSSLARRRMQSENPLVQSVPNFSDFRKENTKPYSASSKTGRPQLRNYTRSRSTNEELPNVKEEKARRSQSVKKTTTSPAEFKGMSASNTDAAVLSPRKFDTGQTEQSRYDKYAQPIEPKPFLQNKFSVVRGAGDMKLKASMMFKSMDNDEESDELAFDPEDSEAIVKDDDEEASLNRTAEDNLGMDHREPSVGRESAKMDTSGSEDGDALQSSSQVDKSLFPSSTHSTLHAVGAVQESPGESPMSWNSRIQHPFSYPHDGSDIDASVDSPMGSPASWNLHALNQTEADAARMRKKWGSAQKPMIGANLSSTQSRKDVSKGFKRLLKFGRKSRGTETLVDWISATTSEGDDDTEDGRDLANRSSEDLRKSRMGFSQDHASEECFHESDFYSEQALRSSIPAPPANFRMREDHLSGSSMKAPRSSFFSLSSFRSKGESKLR